jgi:sterol 3beta-glucosyltransferase
LEIEEVHLLGSSDTLKMTVLDNDETFAMDEFYFCFFSRTREAFTKLQTCLNATSDESKSKPALRIVSSEPSSTTKFKDSVKDTTTFIQAPSPSADNFDGGPGSPRHSSESIRGDIMDDADLLTSGQSSPKRRSLRLSRAALRHFSLGSFNSGSGRRSPSPSPLRTSADGFDRISHSRNSSSVSIVPQEEPSWSDAGKMLWSRGVNVADWMKQRSAAVGTQVGSLLSSPTSTLNAGVGKVSQFWSGDTTKSEHAKWVSEETAKDMKDQNPEERFQTHFALPPSEKLLGAYYGYVFRTFPFYGKMYISKQHFCFRSLLPGIKTKVTYPHGLD